MGSAIKSVPTTFLRSFLELVERASSDSLSSSNRKTLSVRNRFASETTRKHRPDYKMLMFAGLIALIGLVLMYAMSPQRANSINIIEGEDIYSPLYFFMKHTFSLAVSVVVFIFFSSYSILNYKKMSLFILSIGIGAGFLLWLLSLSGSPLAICTKGACRWLALPGIGSLQVAEVLKFSLLIFFSTFWSYFVKKKSFNSTQNLIFSLPVILISLLLVVVAQSDLGTAISMTAMLLAMIVAAGIKQKYLIIIIAVLFGGFMFSILATPYRRERVMTYIQGDKTSSEDNSRHSNQAKIAIGSGGLFGLGVGKSIQAAGYLPESLNDSIFAIIGEVLGFLGTTILLGLFYFMLSRMYMITSNSHEPYHRLLAAGVFAWIFSHTFINIASMTGLMPMTGITLPFLSFGGTSLVIISGALGIIFNVSRYTARIPLIEMGSNYEQ